MWLIDLAHGYMYINEYQFISPMAVCINEYQLLLAKLNSGQLLNLGLPTKFAGSRCIRPRQEKKRAFFCMSIARTCRSCDMFLRHVLSTVEIMSQDHDMFSATCKICMSLYFRRFYCTRVLNLVLLNLVCILNLVLNLGPWYM